MEDKKINILIVNYNTQKLIDGCIKSINKHTPNAKIYVFDNSDKEPFVNTYKNVTVFDNTKGDIINFDEWLNNFPEHTLSPIGRGNNYASSKHCVSVQKGIDLIDDNVILMDSDVLVKKDISELYDDSCIYVGGYELNNIHLKRLMPFICFINVNMSKEYGIRYFDDKRIVGLTVDGEKYDTGSSFFFDSEKYNHRVVNIFNYITHFAQGSWRRKGQGEELWLRRYSALWETNNPDLDIFICTHKDFKPPVISSQYKIVNSRDIDRKYNGLDDRFYSELFQYFYVAENYKLKKYVGFCHYRRYFSFMDNIPNIDEIFKDNEIIIGKPKTYKPSVREFYARCHNIEDLNIVESIIKEKYNEYYDVFEVYMGQDKIIQNNMFIMRREDFLRYIEFVKGVLDEYLKIVGTDIYKRIEDNKDKYLKNFSPNNTADYQYRIGGYLAERLTGVFIMKNFKRARGYEIKVTEKKYNLKNEDNEQKTV
jgi:hypothetical protein